MIAVTRPSRSSSRDWLRLTVLARKARRRSSCFIVGYQVEALYWCALVEVSLHQLREHRGSYRISCDLQNRPISAFGSVIDDEARVNLRIANTTERHGGGYGERRKDVQDSGCFR